MNLISVATDIDLHATQMDNTTPLSKKVKSSIFGSSVNLDKEIKKFYNVKMRLVLQRFVIIYYVEKKKWISNCHFLIDYANELFKTYMQQNQKQH